MLEWVSISFSRGSFGPRIQTQITCIECGFFTTEPPGKPQQPHSCVVLWSVSSVMSNSLQPMNRSPPGFSVHAIFLARITGVDCHALLLGIFLTQRSNLHLLYCRKVLYLLNHQGRHTTLMAQVKFIMVHP